MRHETSEKELRVLFFEANPFASRLHVLRPLVSGADRAGARPIVLMPRRSPGADMETFMSDLPESARIRLVAGSEPILLHHKVSAGILLRMLRSSRNEIKHLSRVVITSPDDYVPHLWWVCLLLRIFSPGGRFTMVRYRVADLNADADTTLRNRLKRLYFSSIRRLLQAHIVVFDERISAGEGIDCIPDPWVGPFGTDSRTAARTTLGWTATRVVALIGRQDERKGFDVAVPALLSASRLPSLSTMSVVLVGSVDPQLDGWQRKLKARFEHRFTQYTNYISDDELALVFAAADLVLLPYHTRFTSTSGVLVRAAASGTPVVASSHGLVGWRVRRYKLGRTFTYPDSDALGQAIALSMLNEHDPTPGYRYAQGSTEEATADAFGEILSRLDG